MDCELYWILERHTGSYTISWKVLKQHLKAVDKLKLKASVQMHLYVPYKTLNTERSLFKQAMCKCGVC